MEPDIIPAPERNMRKSLFFPFIDSLKVYQLIERLLIRVLGIGLLTA